MDAIISAIKFCNDNQGFASIVLAFVALLVSLYAIYNSTQLQMKIHSRDVKLALQKSVLRIYNAYGDCCRLLKFNDIVLSAKIGFMSKPIEQIAKIIEHRVIIGRIRNEANLLFIDDEPLKKLLFELEEDFMSLSERYIDLSQKAISLSAEAFDKVDKAFPELELRGPHDLAKILEHPPAAEIFSAVCTTPETQKFDKDLSIYQSKFTYEKFDKLFESHLIHSK